MITIENRYDFLFIFDCQDGNPNGDPDNDNTPRYDPETLQGLVSDVCLKRKIRNYILQAVSGGMIKAEHNCIYVQSSTALEVQQSKAYKALNVESKDGKLNKDDVFAAAEWMCRNFFDVRTFGAVMSTDKFNCGQVRGPLQITFARSVDHVLPVEHGISRVTFTKEEKARTSKGNTEFGHKHTVPYGLYIAHGYVNPFFAAKTGFDLTDLELVRTALANLFDLDRSATRGNMAVRGLPIFRHSSKLGSAPAQQLFDSVIIAKKDGVENPRSFHDYQLTFPNKSSLPKGITLIDGLIQSLL